LSKSTDLTAQAIVKEWQYTDKIVRRKTCK